MAVVSLALGIGANTAIFSLADAVIFRELPVRDPKSLYQVRSAHKRGIETIYSYPLYREIRDRNRVFSQTVCAASWVIPEPMEIEEPGLARREMRARIAAVSGNYFQTLGVEPAIGRLFTPAEDRAPGEHPVAVISYRFWRQAFDARSGVTGARLLHNGAAYGLLGVAPPEFTGVSSNDDPDIWVPMMMVNTVIGSGDQIGNPDTSSLFVFGRLKPGVSADRASADLAALYREMQPADRRLDGNVVKCSLWRAASNRCAGVSSARCWCCSGWRACCC